MNIKGISFNNAPGNALNHIKRTNPHPEGSAREELIHGIGDVHSYMWTEEIEIQIDQISNSQMEIGLNKRNLNKYKRLLESSSSPAVVCIINDRGQLKLVDGNHRVVAVKESGQSVINAYIGILPENIDLLKTEI